jgi:hypothetical protein
MQPATLATLEQTIMAYRNYTRRAGKQPPRTIVARFAAKCHCCGAPIKAGDVVTYYPVGALGARSAACVAHVGGLDGNSARCTANIRQAMVDNDYAGEGVDTRYEDDCARLCGL